VWVEAGQIEGIGRIDEAHGHKVRPETVHGCARELGTGGEDAGQLVARVAAGFSLFSGEQECGRCIIAVARRARDAVLADVIARTPVVDFELGALPSARSAQQDCVSLP